MQRATTPTHKFTLPFDTSLLKEIRITYQQNGKNVLKKEEADCEMSGNEIRVTLTQEETLKFEASKIALIQLRVLLVDGTVSASQIMSDLVTDCLDCEVLS